MFILQTLSAMALQPLISGACQFLGADDPSEGTMERGLAEALPFLGDRLSDQSQRLTKALHAANERAWRTLEIALAGESLWTRLTARAEDKAFRSQVRAFLDSQPLGGLPAHGAEFRNEALRQLRAARHANHLSGNTAEPRAMARQAGHLARFRDPTKQLDVEWQAVGQIANELSRAGHNTLAQLLSLRAGKDDPPLLVLAVRYFFRRAIENDQALFQGLAFARLESMAQTHAEAYDALHLALSAHDLQLEEGLAALDEAIRKGLAELGRKVDAGNERAHRDYLDLRAEQDKATNELRGLHQDVLNALEHHRLERRELQPRDSLSLRGDTERQLVKQLVARYRALPEAERLQLPALLHGLGKLQVVAGDYESAQRDFQQVAAMVPDPKARAEALFNGYRTALERRDHPTALLKLRAAAQLDPVRYAPFPQDKYEPVRILGAGGFGVAFLCRHKYMDGQVVIKTLMRDDLDQGIEQVFAEARHLQQLHDPAIIRIQDCGFADPATCSRPYLVMDHFDGLTLDEHVATHGLVQPEQLIDLARQVARGLKAAHGKGILHRDVKPANLLVKVRTDEPHRTTPPTRQWDVKVIDFGLALQKQTLQSSAHDADALGNSTIGRQIAGTIDYAAPEQIGRLSGVDVGCYSDVYGFGKTCCYALFQTPQPTFEDYDRVGRPLAKLLSKCMDKEPKSRFASFDLVLNELDRLQATDAYPEVIPVGPARAKPALPNPVSSRPPRSERGAEPPPLPSARPRDEVVELPLRDNRTDEPRSKRTRTECTVKFRGHIIRAECSVWNGQAAIFYDDRQVAGGFLLTEGTYPFVAIEDGEQANYTVTVRSPNMSILIKPYFTVRRNGQVLFNDR